MQRTPPTLRTSKAPQRSPGTYTLVWSRDDGTRDATLLLKIERTANGLAYFTSSADWQNPQWEPATLDAARGATWEWHE